MSLVVLGDLGGTNVRFSLHSLAEGTTLGAPLLHARYNVREFSCLADMAKAFLKQVDANGPQSGTRAHQGDSEVAASLLSSTLIQGLCMSVCGPVTDGSAILLASAFGPEGWRISETSVAEATGLPTVKFLNDFHAVGLAMSTVPASDRICLWGDEQMGTGSGIAVLGPGTGLGECYGVATDTSGTYKVCCSEGGMSDFVPRTEEEWALRQFIAAQDGDHFVEVEKVVSGTGIFNIYKFLTAQEAAAGREIDADLDARIRASNEPAAIIAQAATATAIATVNGSASASASSSASASVSGGEAGEAQEEGAIPRRNALCARAIDIFITALGVELGNLAVRYLPYGGCFIAGGGIASKLKDQLQDGRLLAAYKGKGHSFACYERVPLYLVTTPGDALAMHGAWNFWHANSTKVRGEAEAPNRED